MEKSKEHLTWNVAVQLTEVEREEIRTAIRSNALKVGGLVRQLLLEWAKKQEGDNG